MFNQWLGKAAADHILRPAALFELIRDQDATTISRESIENAVILYREWLRIEALRAMTTASGETLRPEIERDVLSWIERRRAKDRARRREQMEFVQARDLQRGMRRFKGAVREDVESVLVQLEDQGWLLRTDSAGRTDAQTRWQVRSDFEEVWVP